MQKLLLHRVKRVAADLSSLEGVFPDENLGLYVKDLVAPKSIERSMGKAVRVIDKRKFDN